MRPSYFLALFTLLFIVGCAPAPADDVVATSLATTVLRQPTDTPAPTTTQAPTATQERTATRTSTLAPTATQERIATRTSTLAPTNTPTITLIPSLQTQDLQFYAIAPCAPKTTGFETGTVTKIVDGDTIYVLFDNGSIFPVRYIGIDSPEGEIPFATEATAANSDLVLNKEVVLIRDVSETDRFIRLLRYVVVEDVFINLELVRLGLAIAEDYPPDISCSQTLSAAEDQARSAQSGMWHATQTPAPSAPKVIIITVDKRAEWVDIQNVGTIDVDLYGWNLVSEKGNQDCPLSGIILAGQTLRIWAGTAQGSGFGCGYNTTIWNNSEPDPAVLYNAQGVEVSRK